jgi:hypothetical protein
MDPLITNGIDPVLLTVLEKRGDEREVVPRRKRATALEKSVDEEVEEEPVSDTPKHFLDDLA